MNEYPVAYLLTFNNGYCLNMQGAVGRVAELRQRFGPERIRHEIVNTAPLIKWLLRDGQGLWREFHSPLIFDLACKMSGLTELIYLAKVNGLTDISDGAAIEQTHIFLQHPEFSAFLEPFIAEYQLRFLKPVLFDKNRAEKLERLRDEGLRAGTRSLEKVFITSQLRYQPFCLRGFITFFFTSPLRRLNMVQSYGLSLDRAEELWRRLWPTAKTHLDGKLAESRTIKDER